MNRFLTAAVCLCTLSSHASATSLNIARTLLEDSDAISPKETARREKLEDAQKKIKVQMDKDAILRQKNVEKRQLDKLAEKQEEAARLAMSKAKMDADAEDARIKAEARVAESRAATQRASELVKQMGENKVDDQAHEEMKRRWRLKQVRAGNVTDLSESETKLLRKNANYAREKEEIQKAAAARAAKEDRERKYQREVEFKAKEQAQLEKAKKLRLAEAAAESAKREAEKKRQSEANLKATLKSPAKVATSRRHAKKSVATSVEQSHSENAAHLFFVDNLGRGVDVFVPPGTKMRVPLSVVSSRIGLGLDSLQFSYDDKPIRGTDTWEETGLKAGDVVNVDGVPDNM